MSDALLWNEIGKVYLRLGFFDEAIESFNKAIELAPDSGLPYSNLGRAYYMMGDYGRALFQFRKSIHYLDQPLEQASVWNQIGDAYRGLKDIPNAIQAYKKADDLDMGTLPAEHSIPHKKDIVNNFRELIKTEGEVSFKEEHNHKVSSFDDQFGPMLENQPSENDFHLSNIQKDISGLPLKKDRSVEHISGSSEMIKKIEKSPDESSNTNIQNEMPSLEDLKNSSYSKGKPIIVIPDSQIDEEYFSSVKVFEDRVEQKGNSSGEMDQEQRPVDRSLSHSNIHPENEDLEEILAKVNIYENITRVNPKNDRAWDTLGKLYKHLGRYQDAIDSYQKAIALAPDREVYYYYLGLLYSVEQQNEESILAFQTVLRKKREYVLAHSALAGVYHRMGLENKANHHIAIALPKMNNESAYNRACFYAICGDLDLSFELLRMALKNKDTNIEWIRSDPDLDPVRNDPRYQDLVKENAESDDQKENVNLYSSELEGKRNQLLPIINRSLAR